MKATMEALIGLQAPIHQTNVDKGFWEDAENRDKGEAIMLMITELSEAVEAHRKSRRYIVPKDYPNLVEFQLVDLTSSTTISEVTEEWKKSFKLLVKDTVEDEMADAVIRLLDYCGGFKIELDSLDSISHNDITIPDNFATAILGITHIHTTIFFDGDELDGECWSTILYAILALCNREGIDIVQHVQWKWLYNQTRGRKHGKAY